MSITTEYPVDYSTPQGLIKITREEISTHQAKIEEFNAEIEHLKQLISVANVYKVVAENNLSNLLEDNKPKLVAFDGVAL